MPNHVQKIRRVHRTSPPDLDGGRNLNRRPRVQLNGGNPRLPLRLPHVRHRTYLRKDLHRQGMHQVGCFDLGGWCRDGVVGDDLRLVHWMSP